MLIKYVRNGNGEKFGTIIATSPVNIGWSICHNKDTFDKKMGKFIAYNRADFEYPENILNHTSKFKHIPPKLKQIVRECNNMHKRALKYFK